MDVGSDRGADSVFVALAQQERQHGPVNGVEEVLSGNRSPRSPVLRPYRPGCVSSGQVNRVAECWKGLGSPSPRPPGAEAVT